MKPVTQTRVGSPNGNCFAAAIASIMERPLTEFDGAHEDTVDQYLRPYGYKYVELPSNGDSPLGYHIISGTSPRGGEHAVVGYNGKTVHDPHPQDGTGRGLVSISGYGALVPLQGSHHAEAHDRADMMELRRKTKARGGSFHMQVTEKNGREHTIPVRRAAKVYDAELAPIPPFKVGDPIKLKNGKRSTVAKITLGEDLFGNKEWHVLTKSGDVVVITTGKLLK